MADIKGNFYHEDGEQVIDSVVLKNCGADSIGIGPADILYSNVVPTATTIAPAGSLCLCLLAGSIGLYINTGTNEVPVWKAFTQAE